MMKTHSITVMIFFILVLLNTASANADNTNKQQEGWVEWAWDHKCTIAGGLAGVALVTVGGPVVVAAVGFKAGGIAAGSTAATIMSKVATIGYGGVAVAKAQSVGAAGVGLAGAVAGAVVGSYVGSKTCTEHAEGKNC